jgi:hypothetical protein
MEKIINNKKLMIIVISIVSFLSLLLIVAIIFIKNRPMIHEYKNDLYTLKYDNTWHLKATSNKIGFTHKTGSTLDISIKTLDSNESDITIDELIQDIKYGIEKQNDSYKLISEQSLKVTSNKYDGYELLYENDTNQSMIVIGKKADKLFITNYVADNQYFDILLDSVENILYNFKLLDPKVVLKTELKAIKTTNVTFKDDINRCSNMDKVQYELYDNHYHVKYSIPKCFELSTFDTTLGLFRLRNDIGSNSIDITTNIIYNNLYEYLTDDSFGSLTYDINSLKENKSYQNVKVENEKLTGDIEGYIYKISYDYPSSLGTSTYQLIYLIYSIDYLRTFIIKLDSRNIPITKELINAITLDNYTKYGDNIDRTSKDGYLTDNIMKVFTKNVNTRKYYELKYSVFSKYEELDHGSNKYENRYFGYNYNDEIDDYKYKINLYLSNFYTISSYLENVNRTYNYDIYTNASLKFVKKITINNITFDYYTGRYTTKGSNIVNREVYLLKELPSGGLYVVKISSNQEDIPNDLINDFISFNINELDYQK